MIYFSLSFTGKPIGPLAGHLLTQLWYHLISACLMWFKDVLCIWTINFIYIFSVSRFALHSRLLTSLLLVIVWNLSNNWSLSNKLFAILVDSLICLPFKLLEINSIFDQASLDFVPSKTPAKSHHQNLFNSIYSTWRIVSCFLFLHSQAANSIKFLFIVWSIKHSEVSRPISSF